MEQTQINILRVYEAPEVKVITLHPGNVILVGSPYNTDWNEAFNGEEGDLS
jgi:hypothetical protein